MPSDPLPSRDLRFDLEAFEALAEAKVRLTETRGAGPKARKRYDDLVNAIQQLPEHPCRYRINQHKEGTRILSVSDYRVIYEVRPDTGDNETAGDVRVLLILPPGTP